MATKIFLSRDDIDPWAFATNRRRAEMARHAALAEIAGALRNTLGGNKKDARRGRGPHGCPSAGPDRLRSV